MLTKLLNKIEPDQIESNWLVLSDGTICNPVKLNANHRFFVDRVPIRVYKNSDKVPNNDFFPNQKPMYLFSSIWNADDWATRGGLEKTDWKKAPFVSSYKDFAVEGCRWKDPFPACVSTTTENWWDQYDAWHLSKTQKMDYAWVQRNLVVYDYCQDRERFPKMPWECSISPWA